MDSSRKNPVYSPPRRESIEDHLEVLQTRRKWLGIVWNPKLATPDFIRSLIKKKIIAGPRHEGGKAEGPGVRSRFAPRDYRDLIEVIRLKSRGVTRRKAWILHLWLRGHEYPMLRVRDALLSETRRRVTATMREIAPTGRFTRKFVRRARRASPELAKPGYEILALCYALMTRPSEIQNVEIDAEGLAGFICEDTSTPTSDALPLIESLVTAIRAGATSIDPEVESGLISLFQGSPYGRRALETIKNHPNPEGILNRLHGMFADNRGHSRLLNAIERATEQDLLRARAWHNFIRRVSLSAVRASLAEVSADERRRLELMLEMLVDFRRLMFAGPDVEAYLFMLFVDDEIPAAPPDLRRPVDADAVLRMLKLAQERLDESDDKSNQS